MVIPLCDKIRELREAKDLSIRELARQLKVSAAFMSDVELGRRHPGEDKLNKISIFFNVPLEELKKHDARPPISDIRRLSEANPQVGFAFRSVVEDVKSGKLSQEELVKRLTNKKEK